MERNSIVDQIDSARKSRAIAIAASGKVRFQPSTAPDETIALVRSADGLRDYTVVLANGHTTCTCPDFFRGLCKHVAGVSIKLSARAYVSERCAALRIDPAEAAARIEQEMHRATYASYQSGMRYAVILTAARELAES